MKCKVHIKSKLYIVNAYRWGERKNHSYTVGIFIKKQQALNAANNEQKYRGGKYECEVLEYILGSKMEDRDKMPHKIIKGLPDER